MRGVNIKKTPLIHSPTFSKLTKSDVYLKAEFQQKQVLSKLGGHFIKSSLSQNKKNKMALLLLLQETMHKALRLHLHLKKFHVLLLCQKMRLLQK